VSKLEATGAGHIAALRRVLAMRPTRTVVLSVRSDQLFFVMEHLGLEHAPIASLELPHDTVDAKITEAAKAIEHSVERGKTERPRRLSPSPESQRIVWIDLEMSGLDVGKERIIEVASIITNGDLEVIAEGPDLVIHQPEEILEGMDAWNREHHGASGLIEQVRTSEISESMAEEATLNFIAAHCERDCCPIAGNSIHTDRVFLTKYMPKLNRWLHYRHVDVTTVKELVSRWRPLVYRKRPSKKGAHRARGDILESIAELRFYKQQAFGS